MDLKTRIENLQQEQNFWDQMMGYDFKNKKIYDQIKQEQKEYLESLENEYNLTTRNDLKNVLK